MCWQRALSRIAFHRNHGRTTSILRSLLHRTRRVVRCCVCLFTYGVQCVTVCCRYSAHEVSPTQADRNHLEKHRLTFSNSSSTYHITFRMSLTSIPGFSDEVIRFLSTKSVKKSNGKRLFPTLVFRMYGVRGGRERTR